MSDKFDEITESGNDIFDDITEDSIATAKGFTADEVMDDSFDLEKQLDAQTISGMDSVSGYIPKQEQLADMKVKSLLKLNGANNDALDAINTALMATTGQNTSVGTFGAIKEGWNNGQIDIRIFDAGMAGLTGQISDEQALEKADELELQKTNKNKSWMGSWAGSAATVAPTSAATIKGGIKGAGIGAGVGAGVAAVAGQLGPQVAVPEEIATVPGGAWAGAKLGFSIGAAKRGVEIEAGSMYIELLRMKDENGNHIDPAIAKPIAWGVGAINGALEFVKLKTLISTIPGGKKLFARVQKKAVTEIVQSKALREILMTGGKRYLGAVGTETLTEIGQEITSIIGGIFGKHLSNEVDKTNLKTDYKKEVVDRIVETTLESAKSFSLLALPGNVMQTTGEALKAGKKDATVASTGKTAAGQAQPVPGQPQGTEAKPERVGRISRTMASEKIIPRLDIDSLGKTMMDIPAEMPEKKPRTVKEKLTVEEEIDPEDAKLFAQAESEMETLETFQTIKPKLYIGNVTARAKEVLGDAFGVDPERIHGFHEGAWPTKRTQIEMTMDEGRGLLVQMENSLQSRVDNGQLNTDSDLSRANADWGDITALRKELGIPKGLRPFRVIREKGTRTVVIENTRDRINKTTQAGALDVVETTQIERLGDVMKRVAKYAKEGFAAGKKEVRQAIALVRYLKKQKQLRDSLVKKITKKPSEKMDFFYREAIQGLQNAIDWGIKTTGKKIEKESLKDAISRNPEIANEINPKVLESLNKKDVADLSYNDLIALNQEIQRLRQLGLLKSKAYRQQRATAMKAEGDAFIENINAAKKPKEIFSKIKAWTLRPTRLFDMLDGGKNFTGRIFNFFYGQTNEDYNTESQNSDARLEAGKQRMNELNISINSLSQKRVIDGATFTADEMVDIWNGWKNFGHQLALKYGGWELKNGKKVVLITDEMYNKIDEALAENEKLWGDTIISLYGEHYDRYRNSVIAAENRDMGYEENYTHMKRARKAYTSTEQELIDELSYRHFVRQIGPAKGSTIERKDIPREYQTPLKGGATETWMQQVRKQEHYINNALHIKDMQAMLRREDFLAAVQEKFGDTMIESMKEYVARIANPDFYKNYNDIDNMSRVLRKNAAIAYISFNLSSVMNQIPSIMSYWVNSSAMDIIQSATQAALHPMQSFEKARDIHYQISHSTIEREMIELEKADQAGYQKIINKIGTTGMYGLFAMDRAIRVIGINAVYNTQIRNGASIEEARNKAVMTTLLTQEAASPKDLARLYSSDEKLNWFLMFSNQLNQIYNITTYDIPAAYQNKNYREAGRSAISLGVMAMAIWAIQNGRLPEDEDDFMEAVGDQFFGSLPLFGSWINSSRKGWDTQLPIQALVMEGTKGVLQIKDGEFEKATETLFEPLSLSVGYPYVGTKEAYEFIEEAD